MVAQNKWCYCETTTLNHQKAKEFDHSIELINDIIIREGGPKNTFSNQKCIDLDSIENILAQRDKRNKNHTMDFSFCISSDRQKKVVLCELRLNYKNPSNLSKKEIESKIKYSKEILGFTPVFHDHSYFVFQKELQRAKHTISRRFLNKKHIQAVGISELRSLYFQATN